MAARYGWGNGAQWDGLFRLWRGESNWNTFARNPSSGAYGIPQSLPASKMAAFGADWRTNPATQIAWGLDYIRQIYGNPANAYRLWMSRNPHWYSKGGPVNMLRFAKFDTGQGPLYPGYTLAYNGTGHTEYLSERGGGNIIIEHLEVNVKQPLATKQEIGAAVIQAAQAAQDKGYRQTPWVKAPR
jgi:hypothetical protein